MDYFNTMRMMELSGINPAFGIPSSMFPRYPPGINPPTLGLVDQKRIKEKFFKDNDSLNSKLEDFTRMYQKFASGLFEAAYPTTSPGHPMFSKLQSASSLRSENDKLKKENMELKKQISKNKK